MGPGGTPTVIDIDKTVNSENKGFKGPESTRSPCMCMHMHMYTKKLKVKRSAAERQSKGKAGQLNATRMGKLCQKVSHPITGSIT